MNIQKQVTQSMVAERAGVSFITVSRVLTSPQKVAPETRERVIAAIKETGYVVNQAARTLAAQRTNIVGLLIPTITNSTYAALVAGLETPLRDAGYDVILAQTGYDPEREMHAVGVMLGRQPEGLILYNQNHTRELKSQIERYNIPVVEVWALPSAPIDVAVGFSLAEAGRLAAEHFISRGRKEIAFFGGDHVNDKQRYRGFAGTTRKHQGVKTQFIRTPKEDQDRHYFERGPAYLNVIFDCEPRPEAIFCSSDTLAAAIVFEGSRQGIRFPEDLAICGFGGLPLSTGMIPALTTIELPAEQMGHKAAHALISKCSGENFPPKREKLPIRLAVRETT